MEDFDHPGDAELADTLAGIIGQLRLRGYRSIHERLDDALQGDCRSFVTRLSEHLAQEDRVLLPALIKADPSSRAEMEAYRKDHRTLVRYGSKLIRYIKADDDRNACRLARDFLALMMDHDVVHPVLLAKFCPHQSPPLPRVDRPRYCRTARRMRSAADVPRCFARPRIACRSSRSKSPPIRSGFSTTRGRPAPGLAPPRPSRFFARPVTSEVYARAF